MEIGAEKPLTKQQAADHMQVSLQKFSSLIRKGAIPKQYIHVLAGGSQPRFFASELNKCYISRKEKEDDAKA